ncbi:MAG: aspartate-semialdehyde dehydrogenase [Actinobacteria bacterium]|nr:aspartate-semialdehyde dehydrogenase [Actinomycetota bacterium]
MPGQRVAILGATGMVGREFIGILQQRDFPVSELVLLASDRSAGKTMAFRSREIVVQETTPDSFRGIDIVLASAGAEISREFSPIAAAAGAVVVDNSRAFRMDPEIPLVVPEVNIEDAKGHHGIIANPNCSTIQMVVALNPIHKINPIRRIIVDTYQAVSGTGSNAVDELMDQSRVVLEGGEAKPKVYPQQIAFNVLPHIEPFQENGYSREEMKMLHETRKIMHAPDILVSATTVRVPISVGHSESMHVELTEPMTPEEAREILSRAPGVVVMDDPANNVYPTPWFAAGRDETFVGRIRKDISHPNGLAIWVVADNIRKGAALNAVQIAEALIQNSWL